MTALIPRATIDQIEAYRDSAIRLFGESYDREREALAAVRLACPSAHDSAVQASEDRRYKAREEWLEARRKEVDRAVWSHLIQVTNLEKLMDHTARDQFRKQLADNPPEATADNCWATMSQLFGDADMIFKRGIATAFSTLDRRFRSHDGFKIGSRIVLSGAFSEHGAWNHYRNHDETLRDIERTFLTLDGQPHPERLAGFLGLVDTARHKIGGFGRKAFRVENEYFDLRAFKNGNAHLWFKRTDLVERVNLLLADYYGAALGASADVADVKHAPKTGVAKNFGFFESPAPVVRRLLDLGAVWTRETHSGSYPKLSILEPNAGLGAIALAATRHGHHVTCVELQRQHALRLTEEGAYQRVLTADFLSLTTSDLGLFDRVIMNPPFDGGRDIDHVAHALQFLAPGGRLAAVMSAGVEFREDKKSQAFRAFVERYGGRFHDLPLGSFAESGTMVNTVICVLQAPAVQRTNQPQTEVQHA